MLSIFGRQRKLYIGIVILLIITVLEGLYSVHLNNLYYQSYSPFYDSVAYMNQMSSVMEKSRASGVLSATTSLINSSTVFLPFLGAALLGLIFEPSRAIGIWLQVFWLAILAISIFYYFFRSSRTDIVTSIALTLPFICIAALWRRNGGLSDFRMDLHLYLLTSITLTWFLIARHTSALYPWIIAGLFAGGACLSRATAPVYLLIALGPILATRLLCTSSQLERLQLLKGYICMFFSAIVVAAWFYIISFKSLHYYYFVWNLDANAKLPISQSIRHLNFALESIGWFAPVLGAVVLPFTVAKLWRSKNSLIYLKSIDWEVLWFGVAPVAFLVLRGAGLNPFVSMPAAFGLTMFLLKPLKMEIADFNVLAHPFKKLLLALISVLLFIIMAIQGINDHLHPTGLESGDMSAYKRIVSTMINDSESKDRVVYFDIPYIGSLNQDSVLNVYIYDTLLNRRTETATHSGRLSSIRILNLGAPADWDSVEGETDGDKVSNLVSQVNQKVDYFLVPSDETTKFFQTSVSHNVINNYSKRLVSGVLSRGKWKPVTDTIRVSSFEQVVVYRNEARKIFK